MPLPTTTSHTDLPALCREELPSAQAAALLAELEAQYVRDCRACPLHERRTQTVFGVGHPRAGIAFVGEGPGEEEDLQGEPFVGRAGQLLNRMIAAMTLKREDVYICNVVKCRPPGNRTPLPAEAQTCNPFLLRQLAIVRPRIIVALGRPASQTLLATAAGINVLRGKLFDFPPPALAMDGVPHCKLLPTFHPAYLLRVPEEKAKAWADLQVVMQFMGIPVSNRGVSN